MNVVGEMKACTKNEWCFYKSVHFIVFNFILINFKMHRFSS